MSEIPTPVSVTYNNITRNFAATDPILSIMLAFQVGHGVLIDRTNPSKKIPCTAKDSNMFYAVVGPGSYELESLGMGLPELAPRTASSSGSAYSKTQIPVIIKNGEFKCIDTVRPLPLYNLWAERSQNGLHWSSKFTIQTLISMAMKSFFAMLNLSDKLECVNEMSVFQLRPDIRVVRSEFGVPIGVIKVKKPSRKGPLSAEKVGGQLYDYMLRLKSFHGLKHVFGIVTTYEEWQIFWLDDDETNIYAARTEIGTSASFPSTVEADECVDNQPQAAITVTEMLKKEVRKLCAAPAIKYNDPTHSQTMLSILLKMYSSPFDQVSELSNERPYIVLDSECWYWGKVTWKNKTLNRYKLPSVDCKRYFLLRDLRGGADGRVWMACSSSGLVCVIKFGRLDPIVSTERELTASEMEQVHQRLKREQSNYLKQDASIITRVINLANRPALIMRHYTPVDLSLPENKQKVTEAISWFVNERHLVHKDLKPEHVVTDTPTKKVRFIDMVEVESVEPGTETKAIKEMMKSLNFEGTTCKDSKNIPNEPHTTLD